MFSPKYNVVFCATPEFAIPSLALLHHHPLINLVHIISMPDRPAGRGQQLKSPPVIEYAKKNDLAFTQTENLNLETELFNKLQNKIDLVIVLAFAQFLKKPWLDLPKLGCFNIHTSLLPKYRGAAPIQYALLKGDTETGVSIQKMVLKMDAGDVVLENKINIRPFEHAASLTTKLQFAAALALEEFLFLLSKNNLNFKKQDDAKVTFAPEIPKNSGLVNFESLTCQELIHKLQAFFPWPGLYFFINNKRIKIFDVTFPQPQSLFVLKPGEVKNISGHLTVGCIDGPVRLNLIQMEGKEQTTDENFLRGIKEELKITKGNI